MFSVWGRGTLKFAVNYTKGIMFDLHEMRNSNRYGIQHCAFR